MKVGIKQRKKKRRALAQQFLTRSGQPIDMEAVRKSMELRNRQFQGIGQFIYQFSQLQFSIRHVLHARLGLSAEYFDIVTGPYDFVMLCNVTEKASIVRYPAKEADIEKVFKECRKLNDSRVLVAHAMWTDDSDGLSARSFSRTSLKTQTHQFKRDELERLSAKAQELMQRVIGFQGKS